MSDDVRHDLVGKVLAGKYTLAKRIGKGGMGEVYRAEQNSTGGRVAIKVMDTSAQPVNTLDRFRYEAQTTAQLTHPNTVRILDFGSDDALFFLVMEYLSGTDLTRFLRAGGQSDAFVAHVLFQVASSLTEAHSRGVIHRDIKPNNIMLIHHVGHPSFVKVIDFGVARSIGGPGHGTRGILGTIGYIAPEQAEETAQPDARTDLYALGCVAYELLTGTLPFEGISHQSAPLDILEAHMGGRSRHILDVKPDADEELAELVMSLIQRDPRLRPTSAGDLVIPSHSIRSRVSKGVGYSVDIPPPPSGEHIAHQTNMDLTYADGSAPLEYPEVVPRTDLLDGASTSAADDESAPLLSPPNPQRIRHTSYERQEVPPPLHATEPAAVLDVNSDATQPMTSELMAQYQAQLKGHTSKKLNEPPPSKIEESQWGWDSNSHNDVSSARDATSVNPMVKFTIVGIVIASIVAVGWSILV